MSTLLLARFLATGSLALLAGIYLGDVVGTAHARAIADPSSFVTLQQAIHVRFGRMMPALLLAGLVGHALWLWKLRGQPASAGFLIVLTALACLIAIAVMTRIVSLPLNQQLMGWTVLAPPADPQQLWQPWELVNRLRLLLAAVAFFLELAWLVRQDG